MQKCINCKWYDPLYHECDRVALCINKECEDHIGNIMSPFGDFTIKINAKFDDGLFAKLIVNDEFGCVYHDPISKEQVIKRKKMLDYVNKGVIE